MIRRVVAALDRRTGTAGAMSKALRYVFPDHWTFLFGEIALYSFVVLLGTGIFLTLFFTPDGALTVYRGEYSPLYGADVSRAFSSVLDISFKVPAGLLIRQTHHWAALVFVAAITVHLLRIFFTGAYRKPRDINYWVGLTLLVLALLEGYVGYSMLDDLLSGMGLAIGNAVALSIPVLGGQLGNLIWDGGFPGGSLFIERLFIVHVLILPVLIGVLISVHLLLVARTHHTDFPGPGRTEGNTVGTPLWAAYTLRSLALFFGVLSILLLLGGLVQINPIWQWGPYDPWVSTNGAQPDWYLGWLIGALRLIPPLEVTIGSYTLIPNPFWGGVLFPGIVFGLLYAWPVIDRRRTRDEHLHNLLEEPADAPGRTAVGVALFTVVAAVFFAGSADRVFLQFGISYEVQLWIYRAIVVFLPILFGWLTYRHLGRTKTRPVPDHR
jgi:ubiquinol-cytochrome c reductase cytochrome b subunit